LTDRANASLGDALSLVEQIEFVRGEVIGASGDHQFRMYVRLTPTARETLTRVQQFKRGADNSIYHKGYPTNYREQGGSPSVQISIAPDNRRADIAWLSRPRSFVFDQRISHIGQLDTRRQQPDRISRWTGFQKVGRLFGSRETASDPGAGRPVGIPGAQTRQEEHRCDGQ
jgi:hypothetical protein